MGIERLIETKKLVMECLEKTTDEQPIAALAMSIKGHVICSALQSYGDGLFCPFANKYARLIHKVNENDIRQLVYACDYRGPDE